MELDMDSPASGTESPRTVDGNVTRKARVSVACNQCRARRSRCEKSTSVSCGTCISHGLTCEWPSQSTIKKRGRKARTALSEDKANQSFNDTPVSASNPLDSLQQHRPSLTPFELVEQRTASQPSINVSPSSFLPQMPNNAQPYMQPFDTRNLAGSDGAWLTGLTDVLNTPSQLNNLQPNSTSFPGTSPVLDWDVFAEQFQPFSSLFDPMPFTFNPDPVRTEDEASQEGTPNGSLVRVSRSNRPHGLSAIQPGLEQVKSLPPPRSAHFVNTADQLNDTTCIKPLIELFFANFGCQFPALRPERVEGLANSIRTCPSLLIYAICALAARFSSDPRVACVGLQPRQYGDSYKLKAMALLGTELGHPTHETLLSFLILALASLGSGSSTETWMLVGLATRMAQDMGLHRLNPHARDEEQASEYRAQVLTFWSVILIDYTFCLAEGRPTSIPPQIITQRLPTEEDLKFPSNGGDEPPRHPFVNVAECMLAAGSLIDKLNTSDVERDRVVGSLESEVEIVCDKLAVQYDELEVDLTWNAANLQLHAQANQGAVYLFLHIFNHAIQALKEDVSAHKAEIEYRASGKGDKDVSSGLRSNSWLHSPRFIGDMLVLANLVDHRLYLAMPLASQCFFLAGKAFAMDKCKHLRILLDERDESADSRSEAEHKLKLFKTLTGHNLKYFGQALQEMTVYWQGVTKMWNTLQQCIDSADQAERTTLSRVESHRNSAENEEAEKIT